MEPARPAGSPLHGSPSDASTVRAMAESTTTETTRRRPPHGHASTSVAHIRRNSSAHGTSNVVLEQALAIARERARVERRLVGAHVEEPAEQQVVVELLAELPVASHRVQGHQDLCLQQPLRWDRRPPDAAVHRIERRGQPSQDLVDESRARRGPRAMRLRAPGPGITVTMRRSRCRDGRRARPPSRSS